MGGFLGAVRGGLAGLNEASGNPGVANNLEAANQRERDQELQRQQFALAPLSQSLNADRLRLAAYVDPKTMKPLPGHEQDYETTLDRMAGTIGQIRTLMGDKQPNQNPNGLKSAAARLLDAMHITRDLHGHLSANQAQKVSGYENQNQEMAQALGNSNVPFELTPEGQKAAFQRETELEAARAHAESTTEAQRRQDYAEYLAQHPEYKGTYEQWLSEQQQKGRGGYTRQGTHVIYPQDAISLMKSAGQTYSKQDGSQWTAEELAKFPPGIVLTPWVQGDKMFYVPLDQRTKLALLGNVWTQVPEAGEVSAQNSNPLAPGRVPTVSTHQVPGMNPGEKVTLTSTSTPQTTGMTGVKPATPSQPSSASPKQPSQVRTRTQGPQAKTETKPGEMPPPPPPFARGTFLSQGRSVMPVVAAMNVVSANVFGGNGEKPLWDYAKMYDNRELGEALNKALTMNSLVMPGIRNEPGIWDTIATSLGVTGWSQERINQAAVNARNDVERLGGEKALQFLSRLMAFQEDLSALRTATKASAAQGSIQTLVRAAPIYNVSSAQNFRDQLGATLNTAAASMTGYPMINPAYAEWWAQGARKAREPQVSDSLQPKTKQLKQTKAKTSDPLGVL